MAVSKQFTFVLGGARSGKSSYAEKLTTEYGGNVLYVATAQAWDDEMATRIATHQAERPAHWRTLEAPKQTGRAITTALTPATDVVLLDCLTLLASNVIIQLSEPIAVAEATKVLMDEVEELLAAYQQSHCAWVVVSNEVGLGVVPPYPLGRVYRDALGRANQRMAAAADKVVFMVSGLAMVVK